MNILILNGSPRQGGNTEILAKTFAETAEQNGHSVQIINAYDIQVAPCLACTHCLNIEKGICIQKDSMEMIRPLFDAAEVIVFASPIYFFTISAQLKCVIDRFYAANKVGIGFKKSALLLDSHSPNVFDSAIAMFHGINRYLKWESLGIVTLDGMTAKGSASNDPRLEEIRKIAASL